MKKSVIFTNIPYIRKNIPIYLDQDSLDSFGMRPNKLPEIPEEMPNIPMPRQNRRRLSRQRTPVRSAPLPQPQPGPSTPSSEPRTDATNNPDDR